jgi:hypothetical protein
MKTKGKKDGRINRFDIEKDEYIFRGDLDVLKTLLRLIVDEDYRKQKRFVLEEEGWYGWAHGESRTNYKLYKKGIFKRLFAHLQISWPCDWKKDIDFTILEYNSAIAPEKRSVVA